MNSGVPQGQTPPLGRPTLSRRLVLLAFALMVAVLIARIGLTYGEFNATMDESGHLASGIEQYQFGTFRLDVEHPPLARLALAALPYWRGIRLTWTGRHPREDGQALLQDPATYWQVLTWTRLGNLPFVVVLLCYVYRWGAELGGREPTGVDQQPGRLGDDPDFRLPVPNGSRGGPCR